MRPTLPAFACLLAAAHTALRSAEVHWDGTATSNLWAEAANWEGGQVPMGGDTVWFNHPDTPTAVSLNVSYPDTGSALNLVLAAGHDLTLSAAAGCELYLGTVSVLYAQTYTLHVPKAGTQLASGTMPATGAVWDVAAGGTLVVLEDFGSKAFATGSWTKVGAGTLRLGGNDWGTLAGPRLQFRALGGLTEIGYPLGAPLNGISEIAESATVRFTCYNPNATLMLSGSAVYAGGVTGVAGTLDLGGHDQRLRALSGTSTGRVLGSGVAETVTLTLGVGDLPLTVTREADGAFAGSFQDGETGRLRLVVQGGRAGYTQVLSGTNTYTGGTWVCAGRLVLGHATDTLEDGSELSISGGVLDLAGNQERVGAITITGGDILGAGGQLTVSGATIDLAGASQTAPSLHVEGDMTKRGTGTLTLGGDLTVDGQLLVESGLIALSGGTVNATVTLDNAGLVGGSYQGPLYLHGATTLSGVVSAGALMVGANTEVTSVGLVVDGELQLVQSSIAGGPVNLNGVHRLLDWGGVNRFSGGLGYGAGAVVDWTASGWQLDAYGEAEARGLAYGALDIAGPQGLVIADGATVLIHADTGAGDTFWLSPRTFKLVGTLDGASITGCFVLQVEGAAGTNGWGITSTGDALYLTWSGLPETTPVPEASSIGWVALIGLTALARSTLMAKRRPR